MIFWRGWGIWVFIFTIAWIFILFGILISSGFHEPDEAKAAADIDLLFSLSLILAAASVYLLVRYRDRTPIKVVDPATAQIHLMPHIDEFMFIRIKYWTHILVVFSLAMLIKSFFE